MPDDCQQPAMLARKDSTGTGLLSCDRWSADCSLLPVWKTAESGLHVPQCKLTVASTKLC